MPYSLASQHPNYIMRDTSDTSSDYDHYTMSWNAPPASNRWPSDGTSTHASPLLQHDYPRVSQYAPNQHQFHQQMHNTWTNSGMQVSLLEHS